MLKRKVRQLLKNVDKNLTKLERIGIKCARRNGSVHDLTQKQSIDLATKISLKLISNKNYIEAFNIAKCVCNMRMGPFKAACAQATAKALIDEQQFLLATKLALLAAPLKGTLKINTANYIAQKLRSHNQQVYVTQIYEIFQKNSAPYAKKAAEKILKKSQVTTHDISDLLQNVPKHLIEIERIGIKCAKRGGCVDDPTQKQAIDTTKKIVLSLIAHHYYDSAFNVTSKLCNVAMGPFKADCVLSSALKFIEHNQEEYAAKMACLIAPLKGKLKSKTATDIAIKLVENNKIDYVISIQTLLKINGAPYAQDEFKKLTDIITSNSKKSSKFIDAFNLNKTALLQKKKIVTQKKLVNFVGTFKKIFNQNQSDVNWIECHTKENFQPEMQFILSKTQCRLKIKNLTIVDEFNWNFQSNSLFKNNNQMTDVDYEEFSNKLNEFIYHINQKGVDFYAHT